MALKATIFKAELQIADMDRGYYNDLSLTLAQHPSETDERMMVRLLAFIIHADEQLQFTRGLSANDEPELWQKSLSDEIELWIDVGLPDEKRIKKACNRSKQVYLYTYGGRNVGPWWEQNKKQLARYSNLKIVNIAQEMTKSMAGLVQKTMNLQCTIQDGQIWLSDSTLSVEITPEVLN